MYLQVFKHDALILVDQLARLLMQKITALVPYLAMCFCDKLSGFLPTMRATLASVFDLLTLCQGLGGPAVIPGIIDKGSIREGRKMQQAQINAHFLLRNRQRVRRFAFAGEHRKPLPCLILDGTSFDLALKLAVELDLDGADFGEGDMLLREAIACLWIGKRIVAIAALEAWVAWFLSIGNTAEEALNALSSRCNTSWRT